MDNKTEKLVTAALFAALICVATMVIKIPAPVAGYLNPGDCAVLLAGWLLSPAFGFFAAGTGSALADIASGYALHAPATFAVKGLMALTAYYGFKLMRRGVKALPARIVSGAAAEAVMVLGYFVFESVIYGFAAAGASAAANAVQGAVGLILGVALAGVLEKAAPKMI